MCPTETVSSKLEWALPFLNGGTGHRLLLQGIWESCTRGSQGWIANQMLPSPWRRRSMRYDIGQEVLRTFNLNLSYSAKILNKVIFI